MSPRFKPEASALALIDYQVGTMQLIKNLMPDEALRNAIMLAKAALALDMPIVLTSSQEDRIQGPIATSLQHVIPDAYRARIPRAGVWLTSTNTMIAELVRDWSTPEGMQLIPLLLASAPMQPVD